jgi:hypothetical protein
MVVDDSFFGNLYFSRVNFFFTANIFFNFGDTLTIKIPDRYDRNSFTGQKFK